MGENIRDPAALPERARWDQPREPASLASASFDQGESYRYWRPRGTRTWLLFFTLAGRGWFRSATRLRAVAAGPGDLHLYRPGEPQEYGTAPGHRWAFHWAHFAARPAWLPWLAWPPVKGLPGLAAVHVGVGHTRRRLAEAFTALHRDVRMGGAWRTDLAYNALERVLLLARGGSEAAGRAPDPRVQALIERIVTRPGDRYSVPALAKEIHLSPSRLSHLFKAETGRSVIETVLDARLREAAQLLRHTPSPVKEIADRLGFATPFYFSNQFRRRYGRSPRAWRAWRR